MAADRAAGQPYGWPNRRVQRGFAGRRGLGSATRLETGRETDRRRLPDAERRRERRDRDQHLVAIPRSVRQRPHVGNGHLLVVPGAYSRTSIAREGFGDFYSNPKTRTFARLLIDLEESPHSGPPCLANLSGMNWVASLQGRASCSSPRPQMAHAMSNSPGIQSSSGEVES